ncbi:MAG: hypothetical protein MH137_00015 [Flavobacteriales bacterium]|nr:hypothetical protein [Flavobacteriales bacterium]
MDKIGGLLAGLLLCSVKFGMAFLPTIRLHGFSFGESVLFGITAGLLGNLVFIYAGDLINRLIERIAERLRKNKPKKFKKKITKSSRRMVLIKAKYGLPGIAFLTPLFLSIPVGNFLAVRYFKNKKLILVYMMASVTAWTVFFSAINELIR